MKTKRPDALLKPPNKVTVLLAVGIALALGAAAGIGGYTFVYARGASYLSNDPRACANCHITQDHLDAWFKSSHRSVATCNDCHTPPERKQEARNPFFRVVELTDGTEDPAVWGKNFPMQYDAYRRTVDQQRTRFGGSEALPRKGQLALRPSNVTSPGTAAQR